MPIEGSPPNYLNEALTRGFSPYFDRIAAWFWGHEHNFVVFKDGQSGLKKGRLLGCSAYEETLGEDPYDKFPDAGYAPDMTKVGFSPTKAPRNLLQPRLDAAEGRAGQNRREILPVSELGSGIYAGRRWIHRNCR